MHTTPSNLSDEQLVGEIKQLVSEEYRSLAELLSLLAEMDERRLYAKLGYSSLFVYMVEALHLSEDATYKRIQVARAARKYPVILSLISESKLNLTTVNILVPILTGENHGELLLRAVFKSTREVEKMRATYAPQPDIPDRVRKLPQSTCAGASCICEKEGSVVIARSEATKQSPYHQGIASLPSEARNDILWATLQSRDTISPLSEQRVKFQFTGSEELRSKIERAKALLRHKHPAAKLEDIIDEALDALLANKDPEKRIERKARKHVSQHRTHCSGNTHARYIPQRVKDAVWQRDGGRCQYVAADGKRCEERGFLEFDHIKPWAKGGSSNDPANIRLFCHAHNQWAMRNAFGVLKSRPIP